MTVELLPCPFCGSSIVGHLEESTDPRVRIGVVGCGVCGCSGPRLWDTREEFAERWNRRAKPCEHVWENACNKVVTSGEWCPKCGLIREGNR